VTVAEKLMRLLFWLERRKECCWLLRSVTVWSLHLCWEDTLWSGEHGAVALRR